MKYVVDADYAQFYKYRHRIGGDVYLSSRNPEKTRMVFTLSDGLGSGVKANVLANLTAHMAEKLSFSPLDAEHSAGIIMNTLPICKERKISYATFSIASLTFDGSQNIAVQLTEYDNPSAILFDGDESRSIKKQRMTLERKGAFKDEHIYTSELTLSNRQRLVFFTDGVTQAGLGTPLYPLGWRKSAVSEFIQSVLKKDPTISSKVLADTVIRKAKSLDGGIPRDDITCAVISVRQPRDLIIATGPPIEPLHDSLLVKKVMCFEGKKIISGGTTAQIFSRELSETVSVDLSSWDAKIPPASAMEGVELVTEGMLTLNQVAHELEQQTPIESMPDHAVKSFLELLQVSDRVFFIVGTKINEAHQDPSIPFDIGIRRTIIQRIRRALEDVCLKETSIEYI